MNVNNIIKTTAPGAYALFRTIAENNASALRGVVASAHFAADPDHDWLFTYSLDTADEVISLCFDSTAFMFKVTGEPWMEDYGEAYSLTLNFLNACGAALALLIEGAREAAAKRSPQFNLDVFPCVDFVVC